MSERQVMMAAVRQHLLRAQQRMKLQADKKRSERSFSVGDMVYLKLQPYVQSSLAPRAHQKLSFRYFGPYKILEAIGTVLINWNFLWAHPSTLYSMCPCLNQHHHTSHRYQLTF